MVGSKESTSLLGQWAECVERSRELFPGFLDRREVPDIQLGAGNSTQDIFDVHPGESAFRDDHGHASQARCQSAREPISNPVWIGLLNCRLIATVGQPPGTLVLCQGTKPRFMQRRELGRVRPALPFNVDGFGPPVPCHDCPLGAVQETLSARDTSPSQ